MHQVSSSRRIALTIFREAIRPALQLRRKWNDSGISRIPRQKSGFRTNQKYLTYKAHEGARIICPQHWHFPLSGYDLAQHKIIYLWDVQRRELANQVGKDRKKQLAKEAMAAFCASRGLSLNHTDRLLIKVQLWLCHPVIEPSTLPWIQNCIMLASLGNLWRVAKPIN